MHGSHRHLSNYTLVTIFEHNTFHKNAEIGSPEVISEEIPESLGTLNRISGFNA